mmetsp:Transcript_20475/g.64383  ORF Transcript_20475/g.64383 Transcript_20475/m.64383 type:complete len:213 (+) Transcript_20475:1615-2253(+)
MRVGTPRRRHQLRGPQPRRPRLFALRARHHEPLARSHAAHARPQGVASAARAQRTLHRRPLELLALAPRHHRHAPGRRRAARPAHAVSACRRARTSRPVAREQDTRLRRARRRRRRRRRRAWLSPHVLPRLLRPTVRPDDPGGLGAARGQGDHPTPSPIVRRGPVGHPAHRRPSRNFEKRRPLLFWHRSDSVCFRQQPPTSRSQGHRERDPR